MSDIRAQIVLIWDKWAESAARLVRIGHLDRILA
jgi:hypothetical protein